MAKYANGTNYAKTISPEPSQTVEPSQFSGKVRVFIDDYTFGADSLNSTDYIIVGTKLPAGSQVVDIALTAGSPLVTESSTTLVVGDQGSANRYLVSNAATMLTAGAIMLGPNISTGMGYTVTGITDNYIRISGANNSTVISGAVVKIRVSYVVE
jgi:hypothetical protein